MRRCLGNSCKAFDFSRGLFTVLLAPFVIVALLIKLLVQILFFTGIFCVAAGVTVVDLVADLTRGGRG